MIRVARFDCTVVETDTLVAEALPELGKVSIAVESEDHANIVISPTQARQLAVLLIEMAGDVEHHDD